MGQLIAKYIDGLFPLLVGIFALLFPQKLTKKDLSLKENAQIAKRIRIAAWLIVASGIMLLISALMR